MSLLMEALRKAEEAKRQAQEGTAQAPDATTVRSPPKKKPLSQLSGHAIEAEFLAQGGTLPDDDEFDTLALGLKPDDATPHADGASPTPRRMKTDSGKRAAASVFAAKQAPIRHNPVVVTAALLLSLLPIGGILLWYVLQQSQPLVTLNPPLTSGAAPQAIPRTTTPEPDVIESIAAPIATALPEPAVVATTMPQDTAPAVPQPEVALAAENSAAPRPSIAAATPAPSNGISADETPQNPTASLPELPAATVAATSLRISRSSATPQLHPQLASAYARLQAADYTAALPLYQQVLHDEPDNRDALLGLASTYARSGDAAAARRLYSRLLQLDPRDPLARAGVLQGLSGNGVGQESELKALTEQFPELPNAAFALGNFYAAQGRWSEAQPAYFRALLLARRESTNPSPDYAFNLAVSLERLGQREAALDYYRQAAQFATASTPSFDLSVLNARLRQLGAGEMP